MEAKDAPPWLYALFFAKIINLYKVVRDKESLDNFLAFSMFEIDWSFLQENLFLSWVDVVFNDNKVSGLTWQDTSSVGRYIFSANLPQSWKTLENPHETGGFCIFSNLKIGNTLLIFLSL